jgi:hypothetical protein
MFLLAAMPALAEDNLLNAEGKELMDAVYQRHHQYPYVYEEQSMVLIDRNDNRETRKLRRYSRANADGSVDFLLRFDSPEDVAGVAVKARRLANGTVEESLYLPAFGPMLVKRNEVEDGELSPGHQDESFLGTDYSVESIAGEDLGQYIYVRRPDAVLQEIVHYVIDVFPARGDDIESTQPIRRHYIGQENLYITQTDYFDSLGRVRKRMTQHDLVAVLGNMWRANMMLMEIFEEKHRTLIKIDRRVFSSDYVPAEVFTTDWLIANSPRPGEAG